MKRSFWISVAGLVAKLQKPAPARRKPPPLANLNMSQVSHLCAQVGQTMKYCNRVKKWQLKYHALAAVRTSAAKLHEGPNLQDFGTGRRSHDVYAEFYFCWMDTVATAEQEMRAKFEGFLEKLMRARKRDAQDEQAKRIQELLSEYESECPDLVHASRELTQRFRTQLYNLQHERSVADALSEAQSFTKNGKLSSALEKYLELLDGLHNDHVDDAQQKPLFHTIETEIRNLYVVATAKPTAMRKRRKS